MISRREMLEQKSASDLDGLIRWALHERVVGQSPPSWMRERICSLAGRRTVWRLMGRGIARSYWAVMDRLSLVDAFLSARMVSWVRPTSGRAEWRWDPQFTCLLDQYSFLLQLAF
jgi:hypothetical protein